MNFFLEQSLDFAQQKSYLDYLYKVYPTIPNEIRSINDKVWSNVELAYNSKDYEQLIRNLLDLDLFPIKDSYVAYLRKDREAILRNPKTVSRLASEILNMGLDKIREKCSQPKESNRQIGPMFKNWVKKYDFGIPLMDYARFSDESGDGILIGSDEEMKSFAKDKLGYFHDKGLDFLARIGNRYVIGEAKFLSDFGGHQNAQFNDAIATLNCNANAEKIAILDGVLYIKGSNKMYKAITTTYKERNIMSALMLKNFLYTL
jgi:hypothetical protein